MSATKALVTSTSGSAQKNHLDVTTSKALVTNSDALVPSSFLLLVVMPLLLLVRHLLLPHLMPPHGC